MVCFSSIINYQYSIIQCEGVMSWFLTFLNTNTKVCLDVFSSSWTETNTKTFVDFLFLSLIFVPIQYQDQEFQDFKIDFNYKNTAQLGCCLAWLNNWSKQSACAALRRVQAECSDHSIPKINPKAALTGCDIIVNKPW